MFLHYYDISPGLIGIIIWGIISYLSRKGKKKKNSSRINIPNSDTVIDENFKINQFKEILAPQTPIDFYSEDNNINEDIDDIIFPKEEIPSESINDLRTNQLDIQVESLDLREGSKLLADNKMNIRFSYLLKTPGDLQTAFILKEILDQPLALRNSGR